MSWNQQRGRFYLIAAAIVSAAVLVTDVRVELGVAAAVPYLAAVWLAYAAGSRRAVMVTAIACSLMTLVGMLLSPGDATTWKVIANRSLAVFAITATAVLCLRVLQLLATQRERTATAEQTSLELARHREAEVRKVRVLASVMDDLRIERERLAGEIQQRRAAEGRFRATIESAPTAMVMIDEEGQIVLVNAETEELFGHSRDNLLGHSVEMLVPERFRAQHPRHRAEFFAKPQARRMGAGRDLFGLHRDGSEFPIEIGLNPVVTDDGVFVLSTVVDITARKQLELAQKQLQEKLERLVKERTAELAQSKDALEQSNLELKQFAYIASHDLQSPLRAVAGFANFLQRDYQGQLDEKADDWILRIVAGCKRMQQLINDLLAYSRVESRSRTFQDADMNQVFDNAMENLSSTIEETGGRVTRDELPTLKGDRAQLSQLLQNLIGNGLKYHGEQTPHVHVAATSDEAMWTIAVSDTGIGIKEKYHERIFEIFRRLHTHAKYSGTGIGLAICQRIVRRHGGTIWVQSAEGRGSTFCFTIPKRQLHPPAVPEEDSDTTTEKKTFDVAADFD